MNLLKQGKYKVIDIKGHAEDIARLYYTRLPSSKEKGFLLVTVGDTVDYIYIKGEYGVLGSYHLKQIDGNFFLCKDIDPPYGASFQSIHVKYRVGIQEANAGEVLLNITNGDGSKKLTSAVKLYLKFLNTNGSIDEN